MKKIKKQRSCCNNVQCPLRDRCGYYNLNIPYEKRIKLEWLKIKPVKEFGRLVCRKMIPLDKD